MSDGSKSDGPAVLIAGVGAVGARAARQLVDTEGIGRLVLVERRPDQRRATLDAIGERAVALDDPYGEWPDDIAIVVSALPASGDARLARLAIERGVPFLSGTEDAETIDELLALQPIVRAASASVVIGCGLAPGLSDVLARHAASALDDVDEVHIARVGTSGPASVATMRRALRERPREWRDGGWHEGRRRPTRELVWFPEPVGGRDCDAVASGIALLHRQFPDAQRLTVRYGEGEDAASWRRTGDAAAWGAARVEVWGRRGRARDSIVYGVVERTAVATGTMLAVVAASMLGVLDLGRPQGPGVFAAAEFLEPVRVLTELARRGVKAATFEGVGGESPAIPARG